MYVCLLNTHQFCVHAFSWLHTENIWGKLCLHWTHTGVSFLVTSPEAMQYNSYLYKIISVWGSVSHLQMILTIWENVHWVYINTAVYVRDLNINRFWLVEIPGNSPWWIMWDTHTHTPLHSHTTFTKSHTHSYTLTYMYTQRHTYTHINTYIYSLSHTHSHTHVHAHRDTHSHIHACTHIHLRIDHFF